MSVVQDWVSALPDDAQLELLLAMGGGDFQDSDTVSGLLNYTRGFVFKGTRFSEEADFGFTDIKYIKEEIGKYSARYVRALIVTSSIVGTYYPEKIIQELYRDVYKELVEYFDMYPETCDSIRRKYECTSDQS